MLRLQTSICVLLLLGACGDDGDEPEPPLPPGQDAAAMSGETGPLLDASPGLLDATQQAPVPRGDDASASADGALDTVDAGTPLTPSEQLASLDVLFVVDNSGSMATEQAKLARELPRMIRVLTSGDRYAGREVPPGLTPAQRMFTPVRSLHLGVVSTNVGGLSEAPGNSQAAVNSCLGAGDDGVLQSSTKIAVEGVFAATRSEFEGYAMGEVVSAPDPSCALAAQPKYQEFEAGVGDGHALACVARLGVRGCPFEQPLESAWKALAPSAKQADPLYGFVAPNGGQGDRANAGFLREGAALAVLVLTDEDDCSVTADGTALFGLSPEAEDQFGNLNLRCGVSQDDVALVQPVDRYLRGLQGLKPGHPERVVFAAITGVPTEAIEQGLDYDAILALPAMKFEEDPDHRGFPRTACTGKDTARPDTAFPASRLVKTAQAFGAHSVLESICAESYGNALDRMIDKLVPLIAKR